MQKKHVFYYDLIKIVAAYMVFFYHFGMLDLGNITDTFYIPNFNRIILNLCAMSVPLFFMVNGTLLLRRTYCVKEAVLRFFKLFFLYYFWVIVIGAIGKCFFQIEQVPYLDILLGSRNTVTVHLWFFKTIARLAILTPIFKWIYDNDKRVLLYGILGGLLIVPFIYNYFVLFANWFGITPFNNLPVTGVDTMYSVLYFFLGKMIADRSMNETGRCLRQKLLAVCCILSGWLMTTVEVTLWTNLNGIIYDGVNSSFPTLGALFMSVGAFYLFSKIDIEMKGFSGKVFTLCADNVMGVYIFHPIVVQVFSRMIGNNIGLLLKSFIILVLMITLAGITALIKKIPVLKKLIEI